MHDGYDFHPEAESDLDEIWEYVAADNVARADQLVAQIRNGLENAVRFPQSGHRRPDLTNRPLRFIPISEYLIAYAPDERPL